MSPTTLPSISVSGNLSSKIQKTEISQKYLKMKNLINSKIQIEDRKFLVLRPFETIWLSNK